MNRKESSGYRPRNALIGIAVLVCLAGNAPAQERPPGTRDEDRLQEVVITGSRIARPDLDRLEPTSVVKAEDFDKRGFTDVGQALQELPSFGIQPSSAVNTQAGFGIAQSFVDLYSLGSQRTLTLVNGRRFVSSSTASLFNGATSPGQQVDLNVIPTKLIDRIETVSVGGAPIYGADAIAGTVNVILKKDYEGLDLDAQVGVSNRKDAWNYRFRALGGLNFANGRGNITGVAEVYKADGLIGTARRNFSADLGFLPPVDPASSPFTNLLTPFEHITPINTSGIPMVDDFSLVTPGAAQAFGITNPGGQVLAWQPGSSALQPYNLGSPTGNPVFWQGGDGARLSQFSNILSPQKRVNLDGLVNFKFTDHFGAFGELWFSEEHATNLVAQPVYSTFFFGGAGQRNGNWLVSVNNPFLSAADRALIQSQLAAYGAAVPPNQRFDPNWSPNNFYVARANTDLQSGRAVSDQVVTRVVAGLNGDFSLATRSYTWEVAANYGYSRDTNRTPSLVWQNAQNALNATRDSSGNIVCAGNPVAAPVSTGSATCAPLDIFGQGSPSSAAVAYLTHNAIARSINTQRDLTANMSGDLIALPAGEWKGAVGYEYRRESAEFAPDDFLIGGYGVGAAIAPVSGQYHTNEVYAETLIPVFEPLQAIPALHQLELEGAVRRVNNSQAGRSTTWTYGLRWAPVEDLLFRGNKTHSIRAPAITELFLPGSTNFEFANDPCDKRYVDQGTAPARRKANCQAEGIDTSTFTSNVANATAQGITSGNPNLTSEIADAKTVGVVLRPRFIPHFNLSIDYIQINLTNSIAQLTLVNLMDACYDSPDYPNNPSCSKFTRNAQHQVTSFHDGFVNAGVLDFQGVTVGADWSMTLPHNWGALELRGNWLQTRKLLRQIGSASPNSLVGELNQTIVAPNGRGTFDVNYRKELFEWYWQAQYIGPLNFDNQNTPTSQDILSVRHWWLINTTLTFNFTKALQTRLIVDNVFNKEPPYPALASGTGGNFASATSLYFSGIIGRTYLLGVDYRF